MVRAPGSARQKSHDVNCFRLQSSAFLFYHICGSANSTWTEYRIVLIGEVRKKFGVGLEEIVETCSDYSYLSRNCDVELHRISELEHQLKQFRSELQLYGSPFYLVPFIFSSTRLCVKRLRTFRSGDPS